jgi:hypothetical protein
VQRRAIIAALLVLVLALPAGAAAQTLFPGVSYEKQVQFTLHGPVVYHVLIAPRPGGLYALKPLLSNDTIIGREKVTSIEARYSPLATLAGVNGDFFNSKDGHPSGILIRAGVLDSPPLADRSSIGVGLDGLLRVERIKAIGNWQGSGPRRQLRLNQVSAPNAVTLYTPSFGPATPAASGSLELTLASFPAVRTNSDLVTQVSSSKSDGETPIPPGGAVLVARGSQIPFLTGEAPVGQSLTIRFTMSASWDSVTEALGGGPVIVRNGKAIFNAAEAFAAIDLTHREPRTAVGQRADGRIVLLAVDGRQPGYSSGVTNFELAQAMVRLGAITASALDSGGSTTMAVEGQLMNRPSDPTGEREVGEALVVAYEGVYAPVPTEPVLSPNGDGVAEQESLSYKLVRPSTVNVALLGPDGVARFAESGAKAAGTYPLDWNGLRGDSAPESEGRWRWVVSATDDLGRASSIERAFWLNNTLGFLSVSPSLVRLSPKSGSLLVNVRLSRAARTIVRIYSSSGVLIKTVSDKTAGPGEYAVRWNGRDGRGRLVYSGRYRVRVSTPGTIGTPELSGTFLVRRVAG